MEEAGLPVIPGSDGVISKEDNALKLCEEIGYPVMVKATAGGGGRGIRIVRNSRQLDQCFKAAGKEATTASTAALNDGKWHHVIVECDRPAAEIRFYVDGKTAGSAPGIAAGPSLYAPADLFLGGTPEGECLAVTLDFARVSLGTLADAKTTIEELYAWQFDGPQYRDFCGNEIQGERRDAGAVEHVE